MDVVRTRPGVRILHRPCASPPEVEHLAGLRRVRGASASVPALPRLSPPIDEKAVASATNVDKPDTNDGVVKVSFPRTDVPIAVDGWRMPPFMGVTSWAAFSRAREGVAESMIMGDLVLFEDEVSAVMSVLLDNGIAVTALHNHFFFDSPHVFFMHIGGEGTVAALGKGVRLAMEKVTEIRKAFDLNSLETHDSYTGDLVFDKNRNLLHVIDQANYRIVTFDVKKRRPIAS